MAQPKPLMPKWCPEAWKEADWAIEMTGGEIVIGQGGGRKEEKEEKRRKKVLLADFIN